MSLKSLDEYLKKIMGKKNVYNLIIAILIGIMLILVSDVFINTSTTASVSAASGGSSSKSSSSVSSSTSTSSSSGDSDVNKYEKEKNNELTSLLQQMSGVGKVKAMIYCNEGEELVPAVNSNKGDSDTNETDTEGGKRTTRQKTDDKTVVTTNKNGEDEPLIVKKISPQITGVLVVAEGAANEEIKQSITTAVSGLFGIPGYQVYVYPMKN